MSTYAIGKKVSEQLQKVELNEYGDYIYINIGDATLLKKYNELIDWLDKQGDELAKTAAQMEEKYTGRPMVSKDKDGNVDVDTEQFAIFVRIKNDLYSGCVKKIDELFGEGTMRKYFRPLYEANPDFIPDEDCIMDFLEEISPVLEAIYKERTASINKKYSKNRKTGSQIK